ncbi:MAG: peptide ligase PGM1-related protein [Actinomycetota bacterium]|nr:peptide ligase PGM1-related protein [Actinomycetota bacterium]
MSRRRCAASSGSGGASAPPADFARLQERFFRRWGGRDPLEVDGGTLVVLPSLTFPPAELRKITGIEHYEERLLYLVLQLARPRRRVVYLTSRRLDPAIVDYHLSLLGDPGDARRRLDLLSLGASHPRGLTAGLLADDAALARLDGAIGDPGDAFALPFNVTPLERELAERARLPLYGAHPDLAYLGSKSGSRKVARAAGVPVLDGSEDLRSVEDVAEALRRLADRRPHPASAAVVKLNHGFSGQGNATIRLDRLTTPLTDTPTTFCAEEEGWGSYAPKMAAEGAVVEEWVRAPAASPSVQVRLAPGGGVAVLSTHDQMLGDPLGQVYLGCRFPADPRYRAEIRSCARRVAAVLAGEGVIGHFAIDFLVAPTGSPPRVWLSEINLRVGGTTHPFGMARAVTGGVYEPDTGELRVGGTAKAYVSTDNLTIESASGGTTPQVMRLLDDEGLLFDARARTGATLHLLGAVSSYGKVGVTCIGDSPGHAEDIYRRAVAALGTAPGG